MEAQVHRKAILRLQRCLFALHQGKRVLAGELLLVAQVIGNGRLHAARVKVLALFAVGALQTVRAGLAAAYRRRLLLKRFGKAQKLLQLGPVTTERVVRRHEAVTDKDVHQLPLVDHLPVLGVLRHQVAKVVIRDDDALVGRGQIENVAVVMTRDQPAGDIL